MRVKKGTDRIVFNIIGYSFVIFVSLACIVPFLMILSGSLSDESYLAKQGFTLWPGVMSFEGYSMAFKNPTGILKAYGVSVMLTVCGTVLGLFFTSMTGYVLQRKDFEWRNIFALFFFFTTLFSGGLVPWYILIYKYLDLKDNFLSMLLPPMLSVFYILIVRSFMSSLPAAITESAKIDGAGDFAIFIRLILPLSKPVLASIGLFIALNYWNDWYHAMLFISNENMYPLQYYLYQILNSSQALREMAALSGIVVDEMPSESLKMAMTVITTLPILLLYPFVQKYFVKGLTIGAVKG